MLLADIFKLLLIVSVLSPVMFSVELPLIVIPLFPVIVTSLLDDIV